MGRHSFIQHSKLTDVRGRIDYISNPKRQEHLYCTYSTVKDPAFWDYLAEQNQNDFRASGASGRCIEARELIIALPEEFQDLDHEKLLASFVRKFKEVYGVDAVAALHHNKAMTNFHIHLIFSERKAVDQPAIKRASRNMFYDENGKHVRTKKEILNESGSIRKGCHIIRKGEIYDIHYFGSKDKMFKSKSFTADVKRVFTDFINEMVADEGRKLTVFDHDGPYLATKKIGKHNPMEVEIRADNAARQEWNHTVDEALTAGVPEPKICEIRDQTIRKPVVESVRRDGFHPERLEDILKRAVAVLVRMIKIMGKQMKEVPSFDEETYRRMCAVNQELIRQNEVIRKARFRMERALAISDELNKPIHIMTGRKKRERVLMELASAKYEYDTAIEKPDEIVKRAGYRNVAAFTRAFKKACALIESEQQQNGQKESIIAKLHQYEREAKREDGATDRKRSKQPSIGSRNN